MTFLHPWAVWVGVAAAAVPVVVHFLTRPRPRRLALSTIRFVREAVRQRRARHRGIEVGVDECNGATSGMEPELEVRRLPAQRPAGHRLNHHLGVVAPTLRRPWTCVMLA